MVIVVHDGELSSVLREFARTLATDFPIQGILDHLVERIVDVLPVTGAGVTLITAGRAPRYVAASDEAALRFERLQSEIGQGPCLTAYESGEAVAVPDVAADLLFPRFSSAAVLAGLAAVFTFPLRHGAGRLGALDLYRDTPGPLEARDMSAAQTLADVAAAYLLNAQAREEARASAGRFRHSALHDPLTGLANRRLLTQRLDHAAHRALVSGSNTAILFVDLDRFKQVNDTHGHQIGDELLLAVAHRLASLVRPGDTLARVSGDEFVFLCEDVHRPGDIEVLARRINESFATRFVLLGTELTMTASVGVAFAGPEEDISHQLVVKADMAMNQAKRRGGAGHQISNLREVCQAHAAGSLETDLRGALDGNQLDVSYQPIVRSRDGLLTGVEALLRWHHPERGPVAAVSMVELAEQSGLIAEIGAWVLERGCHDRGQWLATHSGAPLDLAVNVSARQLMSRGFSVTVAGVLARTGMDPNALILEMTENIFIEDSERAMSVLIDLREMGIRLALDDFGTGYSSLSYLRRLPINIVKIDQSFIADIDQGPTGGAIVAAVTDLAHVLGLAVTAEGVETQRQSDEVGAIGCEFAQGFFYGRPVAAAAIAAQLRATPGGPLYLPATHDALAAAR